MLCFSAEECLSVLALVLIEKDIPSIDDICSDVGMMTYILPTFISELSFCSQASGGDEILKATIIESEFN